MSKFNYKISGDCIHQDIIDNTVPETLWQKVYLYLKKLGYDVYAPGQKRNKCTENYVVIKENGVHAIGGNISGYKLFDIIVYNPMDQYSTMEFYVENLKEALKKIEDLRPTGNETPSIIDYDVQAYTTSIEYQQFKSLRR
ncbi:hypothetical protein P9J83_16740 [Clostridium sporogenes]|uniref:Uncharacterized protein n=1 Tax=Clostridium sporogenes TaxID=1509 RepID=A0AAE4JV91_CLOSG|nr:hypothetical protein [Clostridium sporogenes]MDS1005123.1 hypothetical protein [Clostridium sporogenes]